MNTVLSVLIICGFLYLSFVTWMFRRKEGDAKPPSKEEAQPPASGSPLSVVPKSDFDMEEFRKSLAATLTSAVRQALGAETVESDPAGNHGGDNDGDNDEEDPDMDDVDPGLVSPPATGDSIDEIEDALNVAVNPGADNVSKAKAGDVLSGMRDVVFIGRLMEADRRISDGVMDCIAESMRMRNAARGRKKGSPAPKAKARPVDIGGVLRDPDFVKHKKDNDEES
ncbi:hypothetical protein [uncultured Duncaniella sp.]|uniref:hypothetical protein n=1 Tax=uncultured Duncaniella sp. TaxID=2768039 RepID=UPI002729D174|nr:hypothetical protein [uncultured Duncaniella sp.]